MKKYGKFFIVLIIIGLVFLFSYAIYYTVAPTYKTSSEDTTQESSTSEKIAADDFEVLDSDGNQVALSDYFGQPIIINFWATWCGPCASELQSFNELYDEYGGAIQFMMVNQTDGSKDTVDGVKSFVQENNYSFPVFFDTEASATQAYGVYSIPMTVVIDADGNVVNRYIGAMDKETIEKYIQQAIN